MVERLSEQFEQTRPRLAAIAQKMLGSATEADDAVQEVWLRLSRAGPAGIDNLGGWLTTVVSRVCLDMLRARRREEPFGGAFPEHVSETAGEGQPEDDAVLADAIGPALVVVLDSLEPHERLTVVLHDLFGLPFDEIAPIVGRSPGATRQLASRARRRLRGSSASGASGTTPPDPRRRELVEAFLAASRQGDFEALLALLDPDVILRSDPVRSATARRERGAPALRDESTGRHAVVRVLVGRAAVARASLVDGVAERRGPRRTDLGPPWSCGRSGTRSSRSRSSPTPVACGPPSSFCEALAARIGSAAVTSPPPRSS